jgi:predicted ATPase
MTIRGWALAATGDPEAGLALLGEGLPTWSMTGASLYEPYFLSLLAEAHRAAGQANQALELLDQASAKASITGERFFAAELHRLKGDLLLELPTPNVSNGEASLTEAVAIARRQGAPLWELRAATSLARMRIEQGRYAEASGLLEPLVQAPGDGDRDMPDLDAARQLLCVLQGSGTAR